MAFNPKVVRAGTQSRREAEETPITFGTESGSASSTPSGNLDEKNKIKFAGPIGEFALSVLENPVAQQRLEDWRAMWDKTNYGGEFTEFLRNGDGPLNNEGGNTDEEIA